MTKLSPPEERLHYVSGAKWQHLIFTVAITCASRGMILRDRLLGRPAKTVPEPGVIAARYRIASGDNSLDAVLVEPAGRVPTSGVLICHGIGETVEHWRAAQGLLAEHGIASLVFNYSGFGRSTGKAAAVQWERDAVEAFCFLEQRVTGVGISLLGYSLGSGVANAVVEKVNARRLVLCSAFSSLRKAAGECGVPRWMAEMLPDMWDNEAALRVGRVPVLIVHGAEDRLFPHAIAEDLARASAVACELVVVPGVEHNEAIFDPRGMAQAAFWNAVIARLRE